MLTIYHVPGTRGFRVVWLCEEIRLPYRLEPVDFSAVYRASPGWRRLNPVGKVPVMSDDGFMLYESGAMVQYLIDRYGHGRLQPVRGTPEHALYLQWSWFAEATFARPIGEIVNHRRAFPDAQDPAILEEMRERARLCLQAVDGALEHNTYLLSDGFSAADIMMGYTLKIFAKHVGGGFPPKVESYWNRLTARPAYAATLAAERME